MESKYKFEKQIGILYRRLTIEVYEWGVSATAEDSWANVINHVFTTKKFRLTQKKYDTIQKNIDRALKYFKMENFSKGREICA